MDNGLIIIIDDEKHYLQHLVKEIKSVFQNYRILGFESEASLTEGMKKYEYEDVILVIADAILGGVSRGWDILANFKQKWPHVKRVLISDKATMEDMEYAINHCTLDAFLYKKRSLTKDNVTTLRELLLIDRATSPVSVSKVLKALKDLKKIEVGKAEYGNIYRNTLIPVFSFIFYPLLVSPKQEVPIANSTMAADTVYYNSSQKGVLQDLKLTSHSLRVVVEVKNTLKLTATHFRQIGSYLIDPFNNCGFLLFRGKSKPRYYKHLSFYWSQKKYLFLFNEEELRTLALKKIEYKREGKDFLRHIDSTLQEKCLKV